MSATCPCDCHGQSAMNRACNVEGGCGHLHNPTTEAPEARRCASGHRCGDRERVEGEDGERRWAGAQIDRERGVCAACTRALSQSLPHLVRDYVELVTILGEHGAGDGEMVRSSRDLPIPIRLAVKTLQERLVSEVDTWIEPVCERLGIDWLSSTEQALLKPQVRLARAVPILSNGLGTLLTLPPHEVSAWDDEGMPIQDPTGTYTETVELDGVDAALRLLRIHNQVRVVAGRGELQHKLPAPCPGCGRIALVRDNGETDVHCLACRDRWIEKDYERLCLVLASDEHQRIDECKRCDKNGRLPNRHMCDHKAADAQEAA